MLSRSYQARDVSDIHHQISAYHIGNLPESLEIQSPSVGAGSCHDQFRTALFGDPLHLIVVNKALPIDSVGNDVEVSAGKIGRASMGQMSSLGEIHAHDCIAGFQQGEKHSHVGLSAGMGLYIGVGAAKQLLGSLNGQGLHLIHTLAASVETFSRITLRIFIGKRASHGGHHRFGYPVFRRDQFNMAVLALQLRRDQIRNFRIHRPYFL